MQRLTPEKMQEFQERYESALATALAQDELDPSSEPTEANSTLVEFRLTRDGDGTVLRVTESGFAQVVIPAERAYAGYEAHSHGWPVFVEQIRQRAEEFALR